MTFEEIVALHIETFGVEPVITGADHFEDEPLSTRIINAIESGEPYVEEPLEKNVVV